MRVLAFIEALGVTGPARNLLESGADLDLHVATYRRRRAPPAHHAGVDAFVSACASRGIEAEVIDERCPFDPALLPAVRHAIARVRPEVVQTHNIKSHALVAAVRRVSGVPWVAFHHGYTSTDVKVRVYNQLDRHALRRADAVVVPCAAFIRELSATGVDPSRITVVHNAVDPAPIVDRTAARRALGVEDRRVIVSVGRLSREKGHDVLIDACALLEPALRAQLTVLIAGAGPERARLEARAAAASISARFEGFQPSVAAYYAAADLFVLPSRSEGAPNALLEALAAGCPAIATRVGGVPEIVEHGVSAYLVPPDRPQPMRDGIAHLLGNPAAAAGLAAGGRCAAARLTRASRHLKLHAIYAHVAADAILAGAMS